MTADWTPAQIPSDSSSSRMLNTAQGILIGIRRCDSEAAFNELLGAAQRNRVTVFAMAWALVHLASHGDKRCTRSEISGSSVHSPISGSAVTSRASRESRWRRANQVRTVGNSAAATRVLAISQAT